MATKTEEPTTLPPAMALARAMFRAQDPDAKEGKYQDEKEKWLPVARKTLKVLENQGYSLTKADG